MFNKRDIDVIEAKMLTIINKVPTFLVFLCMVLSGHAQSANKVNLNEDDILLFDIRLNNRTVASSVESYSVNQQILVAADSLFDALKLRYQITDNSLTIWKNDAVHVIALDPTLAEKTPDSQNNHAMWASDGFYLFVDLFTLKNLFEVTIEPSLTTQIISIKTDDKKYVFPLQQLAKLDKRRQLNRYYARSDDQVSGPKITIEDQYRLLTMPHGRVSTNMALNNDQNTFNSSAQLTGDFLYHSANLTLSQPDVGDLTANMVLSRYKTAPTKFILGLFDSYSIGSVSGISNALTTSSNGGLGIKAYRAPRGYRQGNLETTLEEIAPPGWDAELYHNRVFVTAVVVPDSGRLLFEDLALDYGANSFEIRLYGPFGEEQKIIKFIKVNKNALGKGQFAYSLSALDKNHTLFNDESTKGYGITNVSGAFDYGVTDQWQFGFGLASINNDEKSDFKSDEQLYNFKNVFSFPNFLVENNIALNQDGSYAQETSLTGSIFNRDNYSLRFDSADNFQSEQVSAKNDKFSRYAANYSIPFDSFRTNFGVDYSKNNDSQGYSFSHGLSTRFAGISINHNLTYRNGETLTGETSSISGTIGLGGVIRFEKKPWSTMVEGILDALFNGLSISGSINYDPKGDDLISQSSTIKIQKRFKDYFDINHYLSMRYLPLSDGNANWQLQHKVAWYSDHLETNFSTSYDSTDRWNLQLGVRFFLGYDYHNNRILVNNRLSNSTATLDVHTYLDRQLNGVPDVLDYNLQDVSFKGNKVWDTIKSGRKGRTILPGVTPNGVFAFSAEWQEGSQTVNNDYVVYTHPGAYIDVNMPFFLSTDLTGFVVRQQGINEVGLKNVEIQLLDHNNQILKSVETDDDGYYEFLSLKPGDFQIQIADVYLRDQGMTGMVTGYKVATSGQGGYVELPVLNLRRVQNEADIDAENNLPYLLNKDNSEAMVWHEDEKIKQNYFTLPTKNTVTAKYSLPQANDEDEKTAESDDTDDNNLVKSKEVSNTKVRAKAQIWPKIQAVNGLLPTLTIKSLPIQTVNDSKQSAVNLAAESVVVVGQVIKQNGFVDEFPQTEVANNDLDTNTNKLHSDAWIIQFQAAKFEMNKRIIAQYSAIGPLYIAQKNNTDLRYLVSNSFVSKAAAQLALQQAGLDGWVTKTNSLKNIEKIN
jgi:5-hydroxyisourate hydrolase-like protein (transthyretin family)